MSERTLIFIIRLRLSVFDNPPTPLAIKALETFHSLAANGAFELIWLNIVFKPVLNLSSLRLHSTLSTLPALILKTPTVIILGVAGGVKTSPLSISIPRQLVLVHVKRSTY